MRRVTLAFSSMLLASLISLPLWAQASISTDGGIEAKSVGFIFPDGSVQVTAAAPGSAPISDTGQDTCWDDSGEPVSCAGTGQDGELQAGVDWPAPRFMDNGDGTVLDRLTGLSWLKDADCATFFAPLDFLDALTAVNSLSQGFCGLVDGSSAGDWRLPNIKELLSLVDYGEFQPSIASGHPFTDVLHTTYWSSTQYQASPGLVWTVYMETGLVEVKVHSLVIGHVWPVRGGQ